MLKMTTMNKSHEASFFNVDTFQYNSEINQA